ncbi:TetR/AcrR family transcriptional regulator [Bradyrhizobium sp. NP1]|uniref:TetR/AcrR family transcriptional regulator n=1 Tax=Bradyrhizobium sp. NP1 TaxID=3049772 RepID=UPI0025A4E555|nr:TetR/AcrR family transcriptional regulator [Bradyrhizobium sp. NP1]WJR79805.1 TetR/AcrR family transcriptional regulator [Bradyrhizobium sp. NP1]
MTNLDTSRVRTRASKRKKAAKPARKALAAGAKPSRSARLSPDARKKLIVEEAIKYFAEVGFDAGTRPLAARLGVTQPLIFRYFPNKDDLLQAVYSEVFLSRWRIEWEHLLEDRSRPLRDRLIEFYNSYTDVIFHPKWMRIFLFAGLKALDLNRWYIKFVEERVHKRVCAEIRAENGIARSGPISGLELELYWDFHGGIFYYGVRRFAYGVPVHLDLPAFIEASVDNLLKGMPAVVAKHR